MSRTLKQFAGLKRLLGSTLTPRRGGRARGTVKWFDNKKGYGFIELEDGGEDVFVHHSGIEMDGYKRLHKGQEVEFDIVRDGRRSKAVNVIRV